jgi:hypothetical protein
MLIKSAHQLPTHQTFSVEFAIVDFHSFWRLEADVTKFAGKCANIVNITKMLPKLPKIRKSRSATFF